MQGMIDYIVLPFCTLLAEVSICAHTWYTYVSLCLSLSLTFSLSLCWPCATFSPRCLSARCLCSIGVAIYLSIPIHSFPASFSARSVCPLLPCNYCFISITISTPLPKVCLPTLFLSILLPESLYLSIYLFFPQIYMSICLSMYLYLCIFKHVYLCLSVCLSIYISLCFSIYYPYIHA